MCYWTRFSLSHTACIMTRCFINVTYRSRLFIRKMHFKWHAFIHRLRRSTHGEGCLTVVKSFHSPHMLAHISNLAPYSEWLRQGTRSQSPAWVNIEAIFCYRARQLPQIYPRCSVGTGPSTVPSKPSQKILLNALCTSPIYPLAIFTHT